MAGTVRSLNRPAGPMSSRPLELGSALGRYGVEFKVLGPIEAWGSGKLDLGSRMPRSVLALLIMHAGRVVSLDRFIDHLWGDEPPGTATAALQVYIFQLRRVLEPDRPRRRSPQVLVTRPPGYLLNIEGTAVDAVRFENFVTQGREELAAGRADRASDAIRMGLALWRGAPYADLSFETFLQPEIARLSELRAAASYALAEAQLIVGEHVSAVVEIKALVVADPLRERRWELLALALYRCGRQAEALRSVADARRTLVEELGIEPGPGLRQLEAELLAQSPTLDWQPTALDTRSRINPDPAAAFAKTAPPPPAERVLVGRDWEMTQLMSAFDAASAGRGGVALVAGEPGIGKTRLAEELAARATREGALVAWGPCHDAEAAPAFWPWVQIVGTLAAEADPDLVRSALGSGAVHIAQIVPDIKEMMDEELGPLPLFDADTARTRLYDAVGGFVHRLSLHRPVVIVVDDLHWADVASLHLLQVVAAQIRGAGVLVLCTYRELEADASHPVLATLAVLGRQDQVTRIRPSGLREADVRRLVESATGATADEEVVEVVRARTEGNPFFVSELVRLLSSEGRLEASGQVSVHRHIPPGVRDTIRLRLSRLPEEAVALLDAAAVIGRSFDVDTLSAASDHDEERILELLEAAMLVGVVLETDALLGYRFSHSLVRETVYDALSSLRRARLHRRVGEALERLRPDDPPLADLALHFREAAPLGLTDKAVTYALRLAEQATARLAFELAEDQFRSADRLLEQLPSGKERSTRQLDVQIGLGKLLNMSRGYGSTEVESAWARAGMLSREVDDPVPVTSALFGVAVTALLQGDTATTERAARQLLEMGSPTKEPIMLLAGNWMMGDIAFVKGRLESGRDQLVRAIEIADSLPASDMAVFAHSPTMSARNILSIVLWLLGDTDRSERSIGDALSRARLANPFSLVDVLFFAGFLRALVGDPAAVAPLADEALDLSRTLGFPVYDASTSLLRGWARTAMGENEVGLAEMEAGLAGIRQSGTKMFAHVFTGLLADARLRAGLPGTSLTAVEEAMAELDAMGERFWEAELHRLRGEALSALGRPTDAVASIRRALSVAATQGARSLESRAAESLRRLGLEDDVRAPVR